MTYAHECHKAGAARGGFTFGRDRDAVTGEVRQALDEEAVGAHAAIQTKLLHARSNFTLCRVKKISAALGYSLEHRTNEVGRT